MPSLFLALFVAAPVFAQASTPHTALPTRAELDSITARGIALYQFDRAAWEASDALMKIDPAPNSARYYVVSGTAHDWTVYFGNLTPARDTFYVVYSAEKAVRDTGFTARRIPFSDPNTATLLYRAKALVTALEAFGPVRRPYNASVIPAVAGEMWVYVYPAQTTTQAWPLGGDERFRMSADGTRILERHRMHNAILEIALPTQAVPAGYNLKGFYHTAVIDNRPEDTDVFAVLSRSPKFPEYVKTDDGMVYTINIDGSISISTPEH